MEKIEANAKKNFFGVELNGENLYDEYTKLKKHGFDSDAAYNDIAARIGDYQKKEVMRPKLETLTREQIQKLNMAEREAEASRRAEMIARREEKRMSMAASPVSPPIYIPSQNLPVPSAPPLEVEDEPSAPPLEVEDELFKPLKIEPLNTSKAAPMSTSTKEKAIAFMNKIYLAQGKRAEFMAKLRKLGGDEKALETIMNDNKYIEDLMRFEKQAIAFMNESHLAQDKRAEFIAKFRELGGDENALVKMITYDGDFLKSLTKPSTTNPRSSQQYDDSSSARQHYDSQINYTPPSPSTYGWSQREYMESYK
jgi:hypothetical protein